MIKYDLHNHTYLSACAQKDATIFSYLKKAKEMGLEIIGITDHCWETTVEGCSDWYAEQNFERLVKTRKDLETADKTDIKVLIGAEGEYAQELLGLNENSLKYVDYLIVPHSHTHMKGFVLPQDCVGIPEKHANYLVKSFISLCNHRLKDKIFGFAHPMYPIGEKPEYVEKVYSFITDEMLIECAENAKKNNMAIEVNLSVLKQATENTPYKRFFDACKKTGCEFFLGSDSHSEKSLDIHARQSELISKIGLTEEDFKSVERRILNG